ncbi:MAG: hypothetical protein P4N24_14375 [Acidobacteriota bacterium]|nr:hypothetical protein [Acidobacteriota bacterium]
MEIFVRQVRERSLENAKSLRLLHREGLQANVVSILRQELDSLVRVIFLLSQTDRTYRTALISASVDGHQWTRKDGRGRITDREMVDLSKHLFNWAKNVYEFGCAFIHLSSFHDYATRDPLDSVSAADRATIASYLNYYHCVHLGPNVKFAEILPYLPNVFDKISSNLECYLKDLEKDGDLS